MGQERDDELLGFIKTYLRQIAETGMPTEEAEANAPVYRVDERAPDLYVLLRDRPDGGGSSEEAYFADRQSAYLGAAMLTALGADPEALDLEAAEDALADPTIPGPAQKALIARAFRGLILNPAALELFIEGIGDRKVLEQAYATALERMQEGDEN